MVKNFQNKKAFSLIELSIVLLIIGVIVAGITQSSRMIGAFKLSSARSLTQSSPVNSITDLAAWYESTSEKSFDAADQDEGQYVDNWYDINPQSTTKINLNQPGATTYQPRYRTSTGTINSLPTIRFDGAGTSGDYLQNTVNPLSTITQADQITIFIVEKVNSSSDNSTFFITTDDGTNRINFHSPESDLLEFDFGNVQSGNGRIGLATPSGFVGNARVVTLIRKPANVGIIRVNGTQILSSAMSSVFTNTVLATNMSLVLGTITANMNYSINAYLGEFIIFRRALKADEISDVEKYLGKKWGINIP